MSINCVVKFSGARAGKKKVSIQLGCTIVSYDWLQRNNILASGTTVAAALHKGASLIRHFTMEVRTIYYVNTA